MLALEQDTRIHHDQNLLDDSGLRTSVRCFDSCRDSEVTLFGRHLFFSSKNDDRGVLPGIVGMPF